MGQSTDVTLLNGFSCQPAQDTGWVIRERDTGHVVAAFDNDDSMITYIKDKLVAVSRIDDDGWIKWDGGKCPVEYECQVDIRLRSGDEIKNKAGIFWWGRGEKMRDSEIVAYRVVGDNK